MSDQRLPDGFDAWLSRPQDGELFGLDRNAVRLNKLRPVTDRSVIERARDAWWSAYRAWLWGAP